MAAMYVGLRERSAALISHTILGAIQVSIFFVLYLRLAGAFSTSYWFSASWNFCRFSSEKPVPTLQTVYKHSRSSFQHARRKAP